MKPVYPPHPIHTHPPAPLPFGVCVCVSASCLPASNSYRTKRKARTHTSAIDHLADGVPIQTASNRIIIAPAWSMADMMLISWTPATPSMSLTESGKTTMAATTPMFNHQRMHPSPTLVERAKQRDMEAGKGIYIQYDERPGAGWTFSTDISPTL